MAIDTEQTFLVDAYSDPVILKVEGRANYMNCGPVGQLFKKLLEQGVRNIVIDFANCSGMDSTFLGMMAGTTLELRKKDPPGQMTLCRLGTRNMELIQNLGLHRLVHVATDEEAAAIECNADPSLTGVDGDSSASAETILEAHQNLIEADQGNRRKFQDVISFLKNQIEQE